MSRTDFDSEEKAFRREIQPALSDNRRKSGACPTPDLLMAAHSGVPFEGSEAVERHVALCPICEQLVRDLAEYEFPAASDAEDRRIRARWQGGGSRSAWSWLRNRRLVAVACAAVLVLAVFLARDMRQPVKSPSKEASRQIATAPPASTQPAEDAFTLVKAAIKLPASALLTFRGDAGGGKTYLADLAAALEPYRQDNYTEAARRLAALARKYPTAAEPAYYAGLSQLFLNQNDAAIQSLQAARRRARGTLGNDISWYLAVAFHRAGRTASARQEAEALCRRASEYQERACAAADELRPR